MDQKQRWKQEIGGSCPPGWPGSGSGQRFTLTSEAWDGAGITCWQLCRSESGKLLLLLWQPGTRGDTEGTAVHFGYFTRWWCEHRAQRAGGLTREQISPVLSSLRWFEFTIENSWLTMIWKAQLHFKLETSMCRVFLTEPCGFYLCFLEVLKWEAEPARDSSPAPASSFHQRLPLGLLLKPNLTFLFDQSYSQEWVSWAVP